MARPSNDAPVDHFPDYTGGVGDAVFCEDGSPRSHYAPVVDVFNESGIMHFYQMIIN